MTATLDFELGIEGRSLGLVSGRAMTKFLKTLKGTEFGRAAVLTRTNMQVALNHTVRKGGHG